MDVSEGDVLQDFDSLLALIGFSYSLLRGILVALCGERSDFGLI